MATLADILAESVQQGQRTALGLMELQRRREEQKQSRDLKIVGTAANIAQIESPFIRKQAAKSFMEALGVEKDTPGSKMFQTIIAGADEQSEGLRAMLAGEEFSPEEIEGFIKSGDISQITNQILRAEKRTGKFMAVKDVGLVRISPDGKNAEIVIKAEPGQDLGNSLVGNSLNILIGNQAKRMKGEELSTNEQLQDDAARHVLTKEQIVVGPEGQRMIFTPGIPQSLKESAAPTAKPGGVATTPGGGTVTPLLEKPLLSAEDKRRLKSAKGLLFEIVQDLNQAKARGETITGVSGFLKRQGGGFARQAGVPISAASENLQRKLRTLQGILGPIILSEKRLSETERANLRQIIGEVSPGMDDKSLVNSLRQIADFMKTFESK